MEPFYVQKNNEDYLVLFHNEKDDQFLLANVSADSKRMLWVTSAQLAKDYTFTFGDEEEN